MKASGYIWFRLGSEGVETLTQSMEDLTSEFTDVMKDAALAYYRNKLTFEEYSIMSGLDFLDDVDSDCIIDEDGSMCQVLVDGYLSNLGLSHKGLCQGSFLVTETIWKDLCNEHDIVVNWANK